MSIEAANINNDACKILYFPNIKRHNDEDSEHDAYNNTETTASSIILKMPRKYAWQNLRSWDEYHGELITDLRERQRINVELDGIYKADQFECPTVILNFRIISEGGHEGLILSAFRNATHIKENIGVPVFGRRSFMVREVQQIFGYDTVKKTSEVPYHLFSQGKYQVSVTRIKPSKGCKRYFRVDRILKRID